MTLTTVRIAHFDVFARGLGGGNPCPIVGPSDAATMSAAQMQAVAAHFGQESGFVVGVDGSDVRLRFFVPRHEMAMCVHATVAAMTALVSDGLIHGGVGTVHTASGPCAVTWTNDDPPEVTVEQQAPRLGPALDLAVDVSWALGLGGAAVDQARPIRSVSVSRPKLMVALRSAADVDAVVPDSDALDAISRGADASGVYAFAPHSDGRAQHLVARQFPLDAGYPEDPATGVAAGALAAYLAQEQDRAAAGAWFTVDIDQGDAMGRPSRLRASAWADADGVYRSTVAGRAELREREDLDLAAVVAAHPDLRTELR